jgi:glycogen synthase
MGIGNRSLQIVFFVTLQFCLLILFASDAHSLHARNCGPLFQQALKKVVRGKSKVLPQTLTEFVRWDGVLAKLTEDEAVSAEKPGVKVVMAALEIGKVAGLKTIDGKAVNIAAGGVATVMNDITEIYPGLLAEQKNGELTVVSLLMDNMDTKQMKYVRNIDVMVDGHRWKVGVHEYDSPTGAKYLFLDNPSFKRFTATPDKTVLGQSVYTMRGLEAGTAENKLEEQRIWSAINQSVAETARMEKADIYVPHDSHMAPASFYIEKRAGLNGFEPIKPVAVKPLVHNEGYLGNYHVGSNGDATRKIWDLTPEEMNHYFMQGDQLMMMAPAVRVAEQNEIYTAISVSEGTAKGINGLGRRAKASTQIDFFERVGDLTNGLSDKNRPHLSELLVGGGTEKEIIADGIKHPDVIKQFEKSGYGFTENGTDVQILNEKARAKKALQQNFGMDVDTPGHKRPMVISFARMVHQKGMTFVAENVEHILANGGQILVGGPVGDSVGEAERELFLAIKQKLVDEGNPNARNFVFIDGAVKGRVKGLALAGGDFFLLPSRYAPCELTDAEALMHGTIPIAHHTGGLDKGFESRLYDAPHPDEQGEPLRDAISDAFQFYADRPRFQKSQLNAMKQDFSVEKNFAKFLSNQRIEVYGKMLNELDQLVRANRLSKETAQNLIIDKIIKPHADDMPVFLQALSKVHPDRRNALMNWVVNRAQE